MIFVKRHHYCNITSEVSVKCECYRHLNAQIQYEKYLQLDFDRSLVSYPRLLLEINNEEYSMYYPQLNYEPFLSQLVLNKKDIPQIDHYNLLLNIHEIDMFNSDNVSCIMLELYENTKRFSIHFTNLNVTISAYSLENVYKHDLRDINMLQLAQLIQSSDNSIDITSHQVSIKSKRLQRKIAKFINQKRDTRESQNWYRPYLEGV